MKRVARSGGSSSPRAKAGAAKRTSAKATGVGGEAELARFLAALEHPLKADIERVRRIVLGVDPSIGEGVKWNSPSFRTHEWFATVFLRSRESVKLVFHRGAKAKDGATEVEIDAPEGMVEWLATDRCLVTLGAGRAIGARRKAFERFVRDWIRQL